MHLRHPLRIPLEAAADEGTNRPPAAALKGVPLCSYLCRSNLSSRRINTYLYICLIVTNKHATTTKEDQRSQQ